MRFHGLLCVRDEADILPQVLGRALDWADAIYVFDTGSSDGTWEIVQDFAARDSRVRPIAREEIVFHDGTRAVLFERVRHHMEDGDWVLRMDADEIHHVTPPAFVSKEVRPRETCIYTQSYDFRLTSLDVEGWEAGRESLADRSRPIETRRRYFIPMKKSEPRMFRFRSTVRWPPSASFPYNAGYVARARLPILHYPHRDPAQLDARCAVRALMAKLSDNPWKHWQAEDWRSFVVDANDPELVYWAPDTPLPRFSFDSHVSPPAKRAMQRVAHAFCLPVLDRLRPEFPQDYRLRSIPSELQREIAAALSRA